MVESVRRVYGEEKKELKSGECGESMGKGIVSVRKG